MLDLRAKVVLNDICPRLMDPPEGVTCAAPRCVATRSNCPGGHCQGLAPRCAQRSAGGRWLREDCYPRFLDPPEGVLREDERGQSQLVGMMFSVLLVAMLLGLAALVAHVYPAKVAVHAAARNCARMGVESLSQDWGVNQAVFAARQTMAHHNFAPEYMQVVIEHDAWDRGGSVVCRVRYAVDVSWLPFVGTLFDDAVRMEGKAASRIEPYKSRWDDGE